MIQTLFGPPPDPGLLDRFKTVVAKTRDDLSDQLDDLFQGKREIDADLLDELEMMLIGADIGVKTVSEVLDEVRDSLERDQLKDPAELREHIAKHLLQVLKASESAERPAAKPPEVIMVVGVNGTGKTTTIGKLAHRLGKDGKSVLLCASDTFRAAAAEQLVVWAERGGHPIVKQEPGSDPSAVVYDALEAAKARAVDCVIVDTAGRLHNKAGLMAELEKMKRTAQRLHPGAPHQVLLVIDAVTGQNGLEQARQFTQTAGVTGLVLTKLDGTAKGGIVVAIARELGLPIRYVGVGEQVDDLMPFDAETFVRSLFEG
jgi:fused signal recognition particle receptor